MAEDALGGVVPERDSTVATDDDRTVAGTRQRVLQSGRLDRARRGYAFHGVGVFTIRTGRSTWRSTPSETLPSNSRSSAPRAASADDHQIDVRGRGGAGQRLDGVSGEHLPLDLLHAAGERLGRLRERPLDRVPTLLGDLPQGVPDHPEANRGVVAG